MAGFSLKKYGDNLIDYAAKQYTKQVNVIEEQILFAMRDFIFDIWAEQKHNQKNYWENQTWNLLSSFYAVLLWNSKIVGTQTQGAQLDVKGKKIPMSQAFSKRMTMFNPIFAYWITNKGGAEWRSDSKEHYPYYGARAYASEAVRTAIRYNRKKGYVVIVGFGMPYGNFNGPAGNTMKSRTDKLINYGLDKLKDKLRNITGAPVTLKRTGAYFTSSHVKF